MDYNQDKFLDLLALPNYDNVEIHNGKYDALYATILINKRDLNFAPKQVFKTGINIKEETFLPYFKRA